MPTMQLTSVQSATVPNLVMPSPASIPARAVSASGLPSSVDVMSFGLSPLTAEQSSATEKLAKTHAEALKLFLAHRTTPELLQAARDMGIKVYDGSEHPWVDTLCRERGVEGFVYTPYTKRYPETRVPEKSEVAVLPGLAGPKTTAQQFDAETDRLSAAREQGLFVKRNAPPDVVMHELFHVLQERNGLPFGVNPEADASADSINNYLNRVSPSVLSQRVGLWALSTAGRLLGGVKEPQSPVAKSLYRQMQREAEADKFFMAHGEGLGLSEFERAKHVLHYIAETKFKLNLSQLLDKDQTLQARLEKLVA